MQTIHKQILTDENRKPISVLNAEIALLFYTHFGI